MVEEVPMKYILKPCRQQRWRDITSHFLAHKEQNELSSSQWLQVLCTRRANSWAAWTKRWNKGDTWYLEKLPEPVKEFGDATRLYVIRLHRGKSFSDPCAAGLRLQLLSFLFEHLLAGEWVCSILFYLEKPELMHERMKISIQTKWITDDINDLKAPPH